MTAKKNGFIVRLIIELITIVTSVLKVVPNFFYLIEADARIAGKNLISILILYLLSGILLLSIWLSLLALFFLYLVSVHLSWLLSLFIIVILNILLLIITSLLILRAKTNLTFPHSRNFIRRLKN